MIKELSFFSDSKLIAKKCVKDGWSGTFSLTDNFNLSDLKPDSYFEITFSDAIEAVRTSSYEWSSDFSFYAAGPLVPKIMQLENGVHVQANCTTGFWEIHPKKKNTLLWKFNPEKSRIVTQYRDDKNYKTFENVPEDFRTKEIKLLFTKKAPLEWSRSMIPFSAIACFTDHCDFDTLENLKLQRAFFKNTGVKVTKGIFLNHFSKRKDNASFENDSAELKLWVDDGHELAYHSLSQSLKSDQESFTDFENFQAPLPEMTTWIDHGFQPYNLSLLEKNNIEKSSFFSKMVTQQIAVFWNYIDSGTGTHGVLNQLNLEHFTLRAFFRGIKKEPLKQKLALGIKNIFFHFYANDALMDNYKSLASKVKMVLTKRKFNQIPNLIASVFKVIQPLFRVVVNWTTFKSRIYPLAKYNPVVFSMNVDGNYFSVFQTLEMVDFITTLSPKNIDDFCNERGLFIAHTYFSVPMEYHKGRMFSAPDTINPKVEENFRYLGEKIKEGKIWNPTMAKLNDYLKNIDSIEFFIDAEGIVKPLQPSLYHFREVQ